MRRVDRKLILPYSRAQVFALVDAIEDYPLFLPWCKQAQIHYRRESEVKATLYLAKGPLKFDFTTINLAHGDSKIELKLVQGPFRNLDGSWSFEELAANKCLVNFNLSFQFANKLLAMALEPLFLGMSNTLIESFSKRADE